MSFLFRRWSLLCLALLIEPAIGWGHPGHGSDAADSSGMGHYLTTADHAIPMVAAVILLTLLAAIIGRAAAGVRVGRLPLR